MVNAAVTASFPDGAIHCIIVSSVVCPAAGVIPQGDGSAPIFFSVEDCRMPIAERGLRHEGFASIIRAHLPEQSRRLLLPDLRAGLPEQAQWKPAGGAGMTYSPFSAELTDRQAVWGASAASRGHREAAPDAPQMVWGVRSAAGGACGTVFRSPHLVWGACRTVFRAPRAIFRSPHFAGPAPQAVCRAPRAIWEAAAAAPRPPRGLRPHHPYENHPLGHWVSLRRSEQSLGRAQLPTRTGRPGLCIADRQPTPNQKETYETQ